MFCQNVKEIHTPRVHCGSCNRDYAIIRLRHICSTKFPCDSRAIGTTAEYTESYHTDVVPSTPVATCEQCKDAAISKVIEARCPQCNYEGRFAPAPDGRCPACTAAPVAREKKQRKQDETAPAPEASRQTLYVFIKSADLIVGANTQERVLSGDFSSIAPPERDSVVDRAAVLSDWLKEQAKLYDIRWWFPHDASAFEFLHKYYANAPTDRFQIPFP